MTGETNEGGVIWICGLAGVGKTTLAVEVVRLLRETQPNVTELDGDAFRRRYMPQAGYQREDRLYVAHAMSNAAWLGAQEGSVCVVSTISLFTEIHERNRARANALHLPFVLALLSAPAALLQARRGALMQAGLNVVGVDINAETPDVPDHQFVNEGAINSLKLEAIAVVALWHTRQAQLVHLVHLVHLVRSAS